MKLEIKVKNSIFYRERAGLLFSDSATSIDILCKIWYNKKRRGNKMPNLITLTGPSGSRKK